MTQAVLIITCYFNCRLKLKMEVTKLMTFQSSAGFLCKRQFHEKNFSWKHKWYNSPGNILSLSESISSYSVNLWCTRPPRNKGKFSRFTLLGEVGNLVVAELLFELEKDMVSGANKASSEPPDPYEVTESILKK